MYDGHPGILKLSPYFFIVIVPVSRRCFRKLFMTNVMTNSHTMRYSISICMDFASIIQQRLLRFNWSTEYAKNRTKYQSIFVFRLSPLTTIYYHYGITGIVINWFWSLLTKQYEIRPLQLCSVWHEITNDGCVTGNDTCIHSAYHI